MYSVEQLTRETDTRKTFVITPLVRDWGRQTRSGPCGGIEKKLKKKKTIKPFPYPVEGRLQLTPKNRETPGIRLKYFPPR